jgi:DNA-binding transcriptional LysR family regulator
MLLRDGRVDLGFVEGSVVAPDLHSRVVGTDHPLAARRRPVLAAAALVTREVGSGTRQAFEARRP